MLTLTDTKDQVRLLLDAYPGERNEVCEYFGKGGDYLLSKPVPICVVGHLMEQVAPEAWLDRDVLMISGSIDDSDDGTAWEALEDLGFDEDSIKWLAEVQKMADFSLDGGDLGRYTWEAAVRAVEDGEKIVFHVAEGYSSHVQADGHILRQTKKER